MEFFIKKNATLPLLKLQVVKDGRSDFDNFMKTIELSAIFFSMVDTATGVPKVTSRPAGFVEKTFIDPNAEPEYYIYYQFQNRDTNKVGRYEGQFMLRNDDGVLILPIREKLYINIQESFIADDLPYDSCYVSEFPCCINGPYTTTTTTSPCPSCPTCPQPTPTPNYTTTTTTFNPTTTTTTTFNPTPTVTPTPFEVVLDAIITEEENVYIEPNENEYLMYVDPEIIYTIDVSITSGSVVSTFIVTSNYPINETVTIPVNAILGLIGGGNITISSNVIILANQTVGQSVVENPLLNYFSLNRSGVITVGEVTPKNFPIVVLATPLQFQQEPTPTPTNTLTPTPTPTETPTPTPTETPTPTPTPCVTGDTFVTITNTNWIYPQSDIDTALSLTTVPYTGIGDTLYFSNITDMADVYDEIFTQTAISQPLGNQGYSLGVGTELQNYYTLLYFKLITTDELIVTWNLVQQLTDQSTLPVSGDSPNYTIGYLTRYENWPIAQRPQYYDPVLSIVGPVICVTPTPTPTQTTTPTPTITPNCQRNIVVSSLWNGATSINSNQLQLTETSETLQIQVNDVITDNNGATSFVGIVSSNGTYTNVFTGPGGGVAFACQFPLTFTGPC